MNLETRQTILKHIKERTYAQKEYLSISKMFSGGNMEQYAGICCDDIANAELIDGEDVRMNFQELGDICVNYSGLVTCREIILRFIDQEKYETYEKYLSISNEKVELMNANLYHFRSFTFKQILNLKKEVKQKYDTIGKEMADFLLEQFNAELCSRMFWNKIIIYAKSYLKDQYISFKYRRLIRFITDKFAAHS